MQTPYRTSTDPSRRPRGADWRVVVAGLLVLACGLGMPEAWAQSGRQPTPAQKEAELKKVNARIEKVRKAVNEDIEKRDKLGAQLRDAELGVQGSRRKLEETRAQRIASESRLEDLEREQANREQELAAERGALAGELRTAYVNGREEQLKMLLNQQDPPAFGRTLTPALSRWARSVLSTARCDATSCWVLVTIT